MLNLLDTFHPLNQITQWVRIIDKDIPHYFAEFTLIYLLFISIVTLITGRLSKRVGLITLLPTLVVTYNLTSFIKANTSIANPQTLYSYPLMAIAGLLIVSVIFKRTRTMARVWLAIMASAVVVGASLIHISAINIMLSSKNYALAETNLLIADSNFERSEAAENAFFTMCYKRQVYCRANGTTYTPTLNKTNLTDIDGLITKALELARISDITSKTTDNYFLLTQVNEPLGAPYQLLSVYRGGVERTIIDINRVYSTSQESKSMIYIWLAALVAFWVWGCLIGYYWHENKRLKYTTKSSK